MTKENLIAQIDRLRKIKDEQGQLSMSSEYTLQAYEMLLATMDSEPVAEVVSIYGDPEAFGEREIRPLVGIQQMPYGTKLYRHAQPAPVIPELMVDWQENEFNRGWNACRAAMLNK